jgi:hypothetical protein
MAGSKVLELNPEEDFSVPVFMTILIGCILQLSPYFKNKGTALTNDLWIKP